MEHFVRPVLLLSVNRTLLSSGLRTVCAKNNAAVSKAVEKKNAVTNFRAYASLPKKVSHSVKTVRKSQKESCHEVCSMRASHEKNSVRYFGGCVQVTTRKV